MSRRYATADLVPARFDADAPRAARTRRVAHRESDRRPARRGSRARAHRAHTRRASRPCASPKSPASRDARARDRGIRIRPLRRHSLRGACRVRRAASGRRWARARRWRTHGRASFARIGRLPPLVVFNACESARLRRGAARRRDAIPRSQGIARNLSLAETLLRAGLAHYVGTHWPVEDASATAFASVFYRELLRGSIGTRAGQGASRGARPPLARLGGLHPLRRRGVPAQGALTIFAATSRAACLPPSANAAP